MDISLSDKQQGIQIKPMNIHGMLWLQTHFKTEHWEPLSNGQVIIPSQDAQMLSEDASEAGINVNFINSLSKLDRI